MRELNVSEVALVAGGNEHQCTPGNSADLVGTNVGIGDRLINVYEGLVQATSHVIERVANALG